MFKEVTPVASAEHAFERFRELDPRHWAEAERSARGLMGAVVLNLNSTARGGGVAELLKSQIPYERGLGVNSRWFVLNAPEHFFTITKQMHNLLQGTRKDEITADERASYAATLRSALPSFQELLAGVAPDLVIVHDHHLLPLASAIPRSTPAFLRLHVDLSRPDADTLEFFRSHMQEFETVIVTHPDYRPAWMPQDRTAIIMPAIDPFVPKNRLITRDAAVTYLARALPQVNVTRPLVTQVSRFDPWKDPVGVIQAYEIAKNDIPDLQLALVGSIADDDPESNNIFARVQKHAAGDNDIILSSGTDDMLVNAVQTVSDAVLQKSLREGFGLTVTEAMWKSRPVIGGDTPGIRLQIRHGKNGLIASTLEEAAAGIVRLITHPNASARMGAAAHRTVARKFLFARYIAEHLALYAEHAARMPSRSRRPK